MIVKKHYIAPSVEIKYLEPHSLLAGSGDRKPEWEVNDDEFVPGQGAKGNYFYDEETDDLSSSNCK